jgi:hypothetical protein
MFTDPMTQFVITIFVTIASAMLPFLLYFWKQHQTKEFVYEVVTNETVLEISNEYKDDLKITYKDTLVKDLKLILIKFVNAGNVPIEVAHFDQNHPVRIIFSGNDAKILTYEVLDTMPTNLDITLQVNANQVNLTPVLLNSGDTFSVKLLVSDFLEKITIDGRIVGVKAIREVKETRNQNLRKNSIATVIRIPRIIGRVFLDISDRDKASDSTATFIGFLFILGVIMFILGSLNIGFFTDLWRYFLPQ